MGAHTSSSLICSSYCCARRDARARTASKFLLIGRCVSHKTALHQNRRKPTRPLGPGKVSRTRCSLRGLESGWGCWWAWRKQRQATGRTGRDRRKRRGYIVNKGDRKEEGCRQEKSMCIYVMVKAKLVSRESRVLFRPSGHKCSI